MSLDVYLGCTHCGQQMFFANITHNLGEMARNAGIYEALWRPDEIQITTASHLVPLLTDGLALLRSDPDRFSKFNPINGWGSYEALVDFVEKYLAACQANPGALVSVDR